MPKIKEYRIIDGIKCRQCSRCNEWLPATLEYFHTNKIMSDGLHSACKKCRVYNAEYQKSYKEQHKEEIRNKERERRRKNATKEKEKKRQYYLDNKEMILAKKKHKWDNDPDYRQRQYALKDKYRKTDKGRQISKNSKHKRKARMRGLEHSLTFKQWYDSQEYFGFKCAYCGKQVNLTRDHFIPLSQGGGFSINNIIPACIHCNDSKGDRDFFIWYPQYKFYSSSREKKILSYLGYDEGKNQQLKIAY